MHKFEKQNYGLKLTLSGDLTESEIGEIAIELKPLLNSITRPFSILVDAREIMTLDQSVIHLAVECQRRVKEAGRASAAIVINSPILRNQGQRIAIDSGSTNEIRYIDSSKTDDWEKVALEWMLHGIEPDPEFAFGRKLSDSSLT